MERFFGFHHVLLTVLEYTKLNIYCNCHVHRQFVEALSCLGLPVDILTVGWIVKLVHTMLRQIFLHSIGFLLAPHNDLSVQSSSKSKKNCFALFGNVIKQVLLSRACQLKNV